MKTFECTYDHDLVIKDYWRKDFTGLFDQLNIRDLRPVFSPMQISTIVPRHDVLILNLSHIKCLLSEDTAYFFVHRNEEQITAICSKIAAAGKNTQKQPFVLFALEKILESHYLYMRSRTSEIEKDTQITLSGIKKNVSEGYLESLLANKKRISKSASNVSEIMEAIEDVLGNDEDLEEIVGLVNNHDEALDELTSILENAVEQIEDISSHITALSESVEDTEEFLTLKLNARRTAIIRADLLATITTLILSFLAVIVGLYGTNIKNGLEQSHDAFTRLQISLLFFFFITFAISYYYLKKKRLF